MENKAGHFVKYSSDLIALLWFYAAFSKLIGFEKFSDAMHVQPIWLFLQTLLTFGLPPAEIFTGIFLLFAITRPAGLYLSAFLFLVFTIYIGMILTHVFAEVPCSCGGLIEHMGWRFHLYFNVFFLSLNLINIYLIKERSAVTESDD